MSPAKNASCSLFATVSIACVCVMAAGSPLRALAQEDTPQSTAPNASAEATPADTSADPTSEKTPTEPSATEATPAATEPTPPVAPAPEQTSDTVEGASVVLDDEPDTEGHGVLGPIRVGALVSAGVPAFLHYSLESRFYRMVGLGVGFGGFSTTQKDIDLKVSHWDVRARWFPFEGSLFLGAGYGASKYTATLKKTLEFEAAGTTKKVPTIFKANIERSELTPMLGWQWIFGPGFTMGLDFGWQMAMGSSSDLKISLEGLSAQEKEEIEKQKDYKDNLKKVQDDFLDKYKGTSLPHVSLGFGWMI